MDQITFFELPLIPPKATTRVRAHERAIVPRGAGKPRTKVASVIAGSTITAVPRTGRIEEDFAAFNLANPHVFAALEVLATRYSRNGKRRISMKLLFELLRYEFRIHTTGSPFRLDNRFTAHFARALLVAHPELAKSFEVRTLRGEA